MNSNTLPEIMDFKKFLETNGVIGYSVSDLDYLLNVARRCARTTGVTMAGVGGVAGAAAGAGIGSLPGWLVGALAGYIGGTAMCTIGAMGMKRDLDRILNSR